MRKSLVLLGVTAAAVLLVTSASAANRGVNFTGIGFIENPGPRPASNVMAMNPEGTVFLVSPNSSGGGYAVYWTRENGWGDHIGSIGGGGLRISSEGTIMSNGIYPGSNPVYPWPGTWTGVQDVWAPIPADPGYAPCGNSLINMYDMGGNGDYAAGLTWKGCAIAEGWLWDKATNTTIALGRPNGKSTRANAVTADGSAVLGFGTMLQGLRRAARWENGTWTFVGDPNGEEPKICAQSGGGCTFNGAGTNGCPEYVDDGSCTNRGTCDSPGVCANRGVCTGTAPNRVCVGGTNPGATCSSSSQCSGACTGGTSPGTTCLNNTVCGPGVCVGGSNPGANCTSSPGECAGTCTGPNAGAACTSNGACPDTLVCINNPDWNTSLFKGEAYDVTDDGQHAVGRNFCYPDGTCNSTSGWISNPDGTFTAIPPPESFPFTVDPFRISQDGKTAVGRAGLPGPFNPPPIPIFWNEGTGTQDLQLFLVQQGLDELFFWFLTDAFDVSADGTVIAGRGFNPDGWLEGFVVDLQKLWVCHTPPGHPEDARTLGIEFASAGDHLAHGDFLGTCEFLSSGGLSRAAALRDALNAGYSTDFFKNAPDRFGRFNSFAPQSPRRILGGDRERTARRPVRDE